jgi:stearoyl-CoA desaturase (delta-9 desaturase)
MLELILVLVMTHMTIVCVTVFLHRGQSHQALQFHPVLSHAMRFWLWLTTGMVTKQWVAIHRKHHKFSDRAGDPHSPKVFGLWTVVFKGAWLYHTASKDTDMVNTYGVGTPDDWIERNLYTRHSRLGISLLLLAELLIFGWPGLVMWAVQMIWIPLWAAGVINGVGHWWGYRAGGTDGSRNIMPWGIVIGGEELHANHHRDPGSAKLSARWWEFDIGWMWIQIFRSLGLIALRQRSDPN